MDLETLRRGDECLALEKDRHISSIPRRARTVKLKPHFMFMAKVGLQDDKFTDSYEVEQLKSGIISNQGGSSVTSAIDHSVRTRQLL